MGTIYHSHSLKLDKKYWTVLLVHYPYNVTSSHHRHCKEINLTLSTP
jgi:hypothetical protein